jgi:RND family efflux transporter MFP subunit
MKKKIFIISSVVIFVLLVISFFVFRKDQVEYTTIELEKRNLTQTVSEIGSVRSSQELSLSFSQSGKLGNLNVKVGDQVQSGDVLAELDYSSLLIKKQEASSSLSIAESEQAKLIKGASASDIAVLEAQVSQALSSYNSAENDLRQVKKKSDENIRQAKKALSDLESSNEELPMAVKQAVESAKISLANTESSSQRSLDNARDSLLSSLDYNFSVGKSALDSVKRILDDDDIENVFSVKNSTHKLALERTYDDGNKMLSDVDDVIKLAKSEPSQENIRGASEDLLFFLEHVFLVLDDCFKALESSITSSSFSQASLDSFKANINSERASVDSSISTVQTALFSFNDAILAYDNNVSSAEDTLRSAEAPLNDAISSAQNTLSSTLINEEQRVVSAEDKVATALSSYEVSKSQLNQLKAPASFDDLRLAEFKIEQAEANLKLIEKQIEDNIIIAPIDGRVIKVEYEVGEQVPMSSPVISLLAEDNFEIELFISEFDVSKLEVGDQAKITFDAFGSNYEISGELSFIEPSSTNISDVIYYKVKIVFSEGKLEKDGLIVKAGMTANVDIISNFKENVFVLPSRAVLNRNQNESYVRVLEDDKLIEVPVSVGISGDQAELEIISDDLKEGDLIVISIKD